MLFIHSFIEEEGLLALLATFRFDQYHEITTWKGSPPYQSPFQFSNKITGIYATHGFALSAGPRVIS